MNRWRSYAVEAGLFVALSAILLGGAARLPFHPDETSWLYQSRDLEALLARPMSLAWRGDEPPTPELTYRLLNAPLAKLILGTARRAAGVPASAVSIDWSWSESWEENLAAGAFPPIEALVASRRANAVLLALAAVALYFCGRTVGGRGAGLAGAVLLATNALVLLHGRRAMAEGALVFAVCIALLGLLHADRHPWLAGAAAGLAFAAKTSAAVWIPLGWIAAAWSTDPGARSSRAIVGRLGAFTLAAAAVTLLMYPVLWSDPVNAMAAMWGARRELVEAQVAATSAVMPWAVLTGPAQRGAAILVHLFFAPLQFAEAANYVRQTASSEAAYLAQPLHTLFRGIGGGALVLGLSMLGAVVGVRSSLGADSRHRRVVAVAILAAVIQAAALAMAVPLSFQRYVLPLVPLVCLWSGYGIAALVEAGKRIRRPAGPAEETG